MFEAGAAKGVMAFPIATPHSIHTECPLIVWLGGHLDLKIMPTTLVTDQTAF